nr:hypothetical protein [Tanacetum cinerariifolium]
EKELTADAPRGGSRQRAQKVHAQASKVDGDASTPLDADSDPNIHGKHETLELKDSTDCHWVLAHVTPPFWKTRELNSALHKAKAFCDAIRERDIKRDKAYAKLEKTCNEALQDLDNNPLVFDMHAKIKALQGQVNGLHNEYSRFVLEEKKWVNYEQTLSFLRAKVEGLESERERLKTSKIQLLQEIDRLRIGPLCVAFEEVAALKEPFVLEKIPSYRPFSKEEYDRAGDDMANAYYPFLTELTADPYASIEQLLLKKSRSLKSLKAS